MSFAGLAKNDLAKMLSDDDTFASCLLAIAVDSYSTECFDWEPDTIVKELEDDFNIQMPQVNQDKVNALIVALTTDQFYRDPVVFWQTGNVLSGAPANFVMGADPLTVDEAAWAVVEVTLLDMPDGDQSVPEFSEDIGAMVGAILRSEGFIEPPQFLKFAEMPRRPVGLDPASEQAQYARQKELDQDLRDLIAGRIAQLNAQLQKLPLVSGQRRTTATSERDFVGEALSLGRKPVSPSQRVGRRV
jgi:hypothetical protein